MSGGTETSITGPIPFHMEDISGPVMKLVSVVFVTILQKVVVKGNWGDGSELETIIWFLKKRPTNTVEVVRQSNPVEFLKHFGL